MADVDVTFVLEHGHQLSHLAVALHAGHIDRVDMELSSRRVGIDRKVLREVMERLGMKKEDFKS